MNSWKSSELGAWAPPLSTLKCGTGRRGATPPGARYSNNCPPVASARATAIDTPTVAFAPRRALFSVPSASIIAASTCASEVHIRAVSYTHLRAHETRHDLVCRL